MEDEIRNMEACDLCALIRALSNTINISIIFQLVVLGEEGRGAGRVSRWPWNMQKSRYSLSECQKSSGKGNW